MSLETLLEAARFVEQQEKKRERLASSSSSSSDHPLAVAPHSNHHNSNEPRGAKLKRERTEQDDLFCEEKMLIIDAFRPWGGGRIGGEGLSSDKEKISRVTGGSSRENGDVAEGGDGGSRGDWPSPPPPPPPPPPPMAMAMAGQGGRGSSSSGWRRWHLSLDFSRHPRLTRYEFRSLIEPAGRNRYD
ncbi:hypothetical protein KM043_005256 [Ampulex compressa]|nr:hypothetical protein KM043_005256 [Ampulex compressa]